MAESIKSAQAKLGLVVTRDITRDRTHCHAIGVTPLRGGNVALAYWHLAYSPTTITDRAIDTQKIKSTLLCGFERSVIIQ